MPTDFELAATLVLFAWAFGLAAIEIEIEGGYGWAERLPTWYLKRGRLGRLYGLAMARRPLTGYHVYAFTIPLLLLHLPYAMGVEWSFAAELATLGTYFMLAVVWDYLWFVLNPAYGVRRFRRGAVWWFAGPWIGRFPLDYYASVALSVALAGAAALVAGEAALLYEHLWTLAGLAALVAATIAAAPLYHRWYRHMRRPGADDRAVTETHPPPAPERAWAGGEPDLHPLRRGDSSER